MRLYAEMGAQAAQHGITGAELKPMQNSDSSGNEKGPGG
jgi:hypothetical protein